MRYSDMYKAIVSPHAPGAIGPYVQGVDLGNLVITSGQIPIDPISGNIEEDVSLQTYQVLNNIQAIILAAGLQVRHIVKTTIFIKNLNDFSIINTAYASFFLKNKASFPARSCVEVARLPKDVKIEMEAIAIRY